MKQKLFYLLPVSAILLGSCSNLGDSLIKDRDSSEGLARIYASFSQEDATGTRTSLGSFTGSGFPYRWDDADAIGAFSVGENGVIPTTNAIFKYDKSIEEDRASFVGTPQILKYDDIWSYYPWSINTEVESGKDIALTIRSFQNYNFSAVPEDATPGLPNGSFGQGEAPAVAWGKINVAADNTYTFDLSFKPVAAYLTVPIVGEAMISSVGISVQVGDDNPEYIQLAGTLTIDMSQGEEGLGNPGFNGADGGYATLDSPGTPENGGLITIDCGRGVQLDPETPTWFWFVVPANMPTTTDTKVTIYVNGNPEFLYTFNRSYNASPIGRNQTIGLSKDNSREPFVYEKNGGIPDNMELAFPDPNFRQYVLENFDTNHDGIITEEEALEVTDIYCVFRDIESVQGIQYFVNLRKLECQVNHLTSLNLDKNVNLTHLNCNGNQLTSLDVGNLTQLNSLNCSVNELSSLEIGNCIQLETLDCNWNQLTSLDVNHLTQLNYLNCNSNQLIKLDINLPKLANLYCRDNRLTSLEISNLPQLNSLSCSANELVKLEVNGLSQLTVLECEFNQLIDLDVSHNPNLTQLLCYTNQLTSLDVSKNPNLNTLNCEHNRLTSLDVSNNPNLTDLSCHSNQLTSLDVSHNPNLTALNCGYNQLTSLDVSYNLALTSLGCSSNQLTSLEVSNNQDLTWIECAENKLSDLDVSKNPNLNTLGCGANQLTSVDVSHNPNLIWLDCGYNLLTSLDINKNPNLTDLYCSSNQLTSLDVSKNPNLTWLWCFSNQLTSLDVSNNPNLKYLLCYENPNLTKLILKTGQTIEDLEKDAFTEIEYINP